LKITKKKKKKKEKEKEKEKEKRKRKRKRKKKKRRCEMPSKSLYNSVYDIYHERELPDLPVLPAPRPFKIRVKQSRSDLRIYREVSKAQLDNLIMFVKDPGGEAIMMGPDLHNQTAGRKEPTVPEMR
jgi:outer membrane biosynthesis protein TonB